jgi:hypothetical protein
VAPTGQGPKDILSRFQRLFRGRENVTGQWQQDNIKTLPVATTQEHWKLHLEGKGPFLGIVPINLANSCYFGAIDVDDHAINHAAVASLVDAAELPMVVCRSKRGGAHLYVFTNEPVDAKVMQTSLRKWAAAMGFTKNHDDRPIEIFPKQTKLNPNNPKDQGNWINLPYYGGSKTERYAVTAEGDKLGLKEFLDLAERRQVSEARFKSIEPKTSGGFSDGPPCLQALDQIGYPEGSRNMGLYNVGIYLKLSQPETWQDAMLSYNQDKLDPPLKDRDVKAIIKSLEHKDYVYKCEDLPIQPHCKKTECKKQLHGIDAFRKQKAMSQMPKLTGLRKVLTDPPRWLLSVNEKDLDLETDQLMSQAMFRKAVLERCSVIVPLLKMGEWDDVLKGLLAEHKVIEAPEDAGVLGQFMSLFYDFLMRRYHATRLDDLLSGVPFEDMEKGVVYFRAIDLSRYLDRQKFRMFDHGKLFTTLRQVGAGYQAIQLGNMKIQAWSIPTPKDEQKVMTPAPKRRGPSY